MNKNRKTNMEQTLNEKLDKILAILENQEKRIAKLEEKKNPAKFLTCRYCLTKKEDVAEYKCRGYENKCHYRIYSCANCDATNLKNGIWCGHDDGA